MSDTDAFVDPAAAAYAARNSLAPTAVQRELVAETKALGGISAMQIGQLQGAFMSVLTAALAPSFAVEIGTFTGYSALAVAQHLPPGGRLLCCDVSSEWTSIAQRYWRRAGVDDRIELRLGPALDTLRALPAEPSVDLAFIDADKTNYVGYYEELVPRLSDRAVILVDNVLWSGRVLDGAGPGTTTGNAAGAGNAAGPDADTVALREFSDHVRADRRVDAVLLPIGDGLTMITPAADRE